MSTYVHKRAVKFHKIACETAEYTLIVYMKRKDEGCGWRKLHIFKYADVYCPVIGSRLARDPAQQQFI